MSELVPQPEDDDSSHDGHDHLAQPGDGEDADSTAQPTAKGTAYESQNQVDNATLALTTIQLGCYKSCYSATNQSYSCHILNI